MGLVRDALVETTGVAIAYGQKAVLTDVSLAISQGEWVAILGPNGTGKSSLLEVLAGLTKPSRGSVSLAGRPILQVPVSARYRRLSYGFQNPEYQFLFERVADEMAGRVVFPSPSEEVLQALDAVDLRSHAEQSPYALSQGQKRRLAVAVMIQQQSDLYLFDEPTYGQDAVSEAKILTLLERLRAEGKAIVTVTHALDLVRRYATRAIVLAEGSVIYDGGIDELFGREDILRQAHLMADTESLRLGGELATPPSFGLEPCRDCDGDTTASMGSRKSPLWRLHPSLKLIPFLWLSVWMLFANDFSTIGRLWTLPVVLAAPLGWCNPWRMAKWLWPIILLYAVYIWTFSANGAVPPGDSVLHVAWFQLSWYGMWQGVLVAVRTFATVVVAYVFLATTDGTDFVVSLSQTFGCTPKLSYGVMAGTGFIPRFQRELRIFRLAKRVRGRTGWWIFRPVTSALPLLAQSIRTSERLATAMEARGFFGPPAEQARARTYFRWTPLR
ncbi:MAG: ATP-binding cassette domain-containing protein, partial [Firmicutes bacterium]|nr:ATP-binding cassette domain-containing protein [Bacillota bacterium]